MAYKAQMCRGGSWLMKIIDIGVTRLAEAASTIIISAWLGGQRMANDGSNSS